MKKVSGLLALVVFTMLVVACSAPADEPAKKWVAFLDRKAPATPPPTSSGKDT